MKLKCDNHTIVNRQSRLDFVRNSVVSNKVEISQCIKQRKIIKLIFFSLYRLMATKLVQYFIRIYPITLALKCDMSYFNVNIGAHTNEYLLLS